jgi:hypothetical protein
VRRGVCGRWIQIQAAVCELLSVVMCGGEACVEGVANGGCMLRGLAGAQASGSVSTCCLSCAAALPLVL